MIAMVPLCYSDTLCVVTPIRSVVLLTPVYEVMTTTVDSVIFGTIDLHQSLVLY